MKEAGRLLERGVHPLVLVEAYQDSIVETLNVLDDRSMEDVNGDTLQSVARTAMVGKSAEAGGDALAKLLVECMMTIQSSGRPVRAENVRMTKRGHDSLQETRLVKGLVIDKTFDSERTPRINQPCSVLALTCPLTIQKTKRDAEIEIERPEQMLAFLDAEEQLIEEKINLLKQSGAKAIFTSKEVDERIQHACNNDGILLVAMMEDDGIEDIAAATGATLINHLDDATTESLGGSNQRTSMYLNERTVVVHDLLWTLVQHLVLSPSTLVAGKVLLSKNTFERCTMLLGPLNPLSTNLGQYSVEGPSISLPHSI